MHECIDASYTGTYHIDLATLGFNDKISSWWCGKSVDYTLCINSYDTSCTNLEGSSGSGNNRNSWVGGGVSDEFSGLLLSKYDASTQGAATLFSDGSCTGATGRIFASVDPT